MSRAWKIVVGVFVVLGVPALLAGWWRGLAVRHPVTAIVLAVVMAVVLGGLALLFIVAGRDVGPYLTQVGSAVGLVSVISGYDRRYCAWLADAVDAVQASQRPTAAPFAPRLEEVVVEPSLVERPPHLISTGMLGGRAGGRHGRPLADFLQRDMPGVLAVVGVPGSGKTTLLRNAARRIARQRAVPVPLRHRLRGLVRRAPRGQRRSIPILLELRSHGRAIAADPEISLARLVGDARLGPVRYEPPGWWEDRLGRGRCLVLLDGLDEVSGEPGTADMIAWINAQIARYPGNDYVITSRPHAYRSDLVERARILQIWPFTDAEVKEFVQRWYRAVERHAGGTDPEVETRARAQAADLLARLARLPALRDLAINPLLLDMIVKVHLYRQALPDNRAQLYREICEWTLWRLREARNLPTVLPGPDLQQLLAELAYTMMDRRIRDLSQPDLMAVLRPSLRRLNSRLGTRVEPDAFLAEVRSSGLLIEQDGPATYTFAHQTFQEYLAAIHVRGRRPRDTLLRYVDDPWWRETILLHTTPADAAAVVRACLDKDTAAALSLGFECAETLLGNGAELDLQLRARLDATIAAAFEDGASVERGRMVAGVLATRALRDPLRTPDGVRIAARPVATGLYRLFLKDTDCPPPDRTGPVEPASTVPASGMWGREARLFVDWLNTVAGAGRPVYRLPTRQDLDDLVKDGGEAPGVQALLSAVTSVWVQLPVPGRGRAALGLWTAPGTRPTNAIEGAALVDAVAADTVHSRLLHQLVSLYLYISMQRLALALDRATRRASDYATALAQAVAGAPGADRDRRAQLERDLSHAESMAGRTRTVAIPPGQMSGKEAQRMARREVPADPGAATRAAGIRGEIERLSRDHGRELAAANGQADRLVAALTDAGAAGRLLAGTFAPSHDRAVLILAVNSGIGILQSVQNSIDEVDRLSDSLHLATAHFDRIAGTSDQVLQQSAVAPGARDWVSALVGRLGRTLDLCRSHGHEVRLSRLLALDRAYHTVPAYLRSLGAAPRSEGVASRNRPSDLLVPLVGRGLGQAVGAVLERRPGDGIPPERAFATVLLKVSGMSTSGRCTAGLDGLADAVEAACTAVKAGTNQRAWAATLATRLEPAARQLLTHRLPVATPAASAVRLAALALAGTAFKKDTNPHWKESLQELATGVTLLQDRMIRAEPLESVVLAHV